MRSFVYVAPDQLDEAIALLQSDGSRPLAGGTDLLTLMKGDIFTSERVVNIKHVPGIDEVVPVNGGLRFGALVTLSQIENDPLVRRMYPALAEAASLAATPQLRNMATIGGNLLQRPRCWYFRSPHVSCWLKGGEECPMRQGENRFAAVFEQSPCWAVHPSDLAPVLFTLGATVSVRGPGGDVEVGIEELMQPPTPERRTETTLEHAALITSVTLPPVTPGTRMTYRKAMDRKIWAFALIGVALSLRMQDGRVEDARVVLGGAANVPVRCSAAEEALRGARVDENVALRVADLAFEGATPLSQNGYKLRLGKTLLSRALLDLAMG